MSAESVLKRMFRVFVTVPDSVNEKEWIFPQCCWWWYVINLGLELIYIPCGFLYCGYECYKTELSIGMFVSTMIGAFIGCIITSMILCIAFRFVYEFNVLLFYVFVSQRATVKAIENVEKTLTSISQVQISSGQYLCDRLADICDEMKKGAIK